MISGSFRRCAAGRIQASRLLLVLLALVLAVPSRAEDLPPESPSLVETTPVLRPERSPPVPPPAPPPGTENAAIEPIPREVPLHLLWQAESAFQEGRRGEALSRFLDLAYNSADGERKGFVWMRVGDLLLARGEFQQALEAADKAISLSRSRYLVLSAMELKFRVLRNLRRMSEARQVAASLLDEGFALVEPSELLAVMARADIAGGNPVGGLEEFRRAIEKAPGAEEAAALRAERDGVIESLSSLRILRDAAEAETDPAVQGHLFLVLGRVAAREGYSGMGAWALERSARLGGEKGEEAARQLYRLEQIVASRPKIVGILPLSGRFSDLGFGVLTGAEVALRQARGGAPDLFFPVLRWRDTAGQPDRARREFEEASRDPTVVGFLGPLTGEEGYSVSVVYGPDAPPVLYLGQKTIPEKPFLYRFGLAPIEEARAVLDRFSRDGIRDLLFLHPENGYGWGFAEAVKEAAREQGIVLAKTLHYPPGTNDFTEIIRRAVGGKAFEEFSQSREKGKAMELPMGGIVIADRWDRFFLLASQLRHYNVYLPLAGFSGAVDPELFRRGKEAIEGAFFSVDYDEAVPGDPAERFRERFRAQMGYPPGRFEATGYDGATLLSEAYRLEAWKEGSRPAGEAVREWLPTMKTFRGITGLFRFGPSGEIFRDLHLMRVESGRLVPAEE
ncbi:MAG: hypothetical protein Kow00128_20360 [Deltaproteobacteria bacterium]